MRKAAAYLGMLLIAGAFAAADYLVLAYPTDVFRGELALLGDVLRFRTVRASIAGRAELEGAELFTEGRAFRPLEVDRVELQLGTPPRVVLHRPRLRISDKLIEELGKMETGGSIRDKIAPEDLPVVRSEEVEVEVTFPELFPGGAQAALVRDLSLTPVGDYRYRVTGALEHPAYGTWRAEGDIDLDARAWRMTLRCEGLRIVPSMRDPLGPALQRIYDKYRPEGLCDVTLDLVQEGPAEPLDFRVTLHAREMAVVYRPFPYRAEQAVGEIEFYPAGFRVKHMTARHGPAGIRFDGAAAGYAADSGYEFRLEIDDAPLDADLRGALDEGGRRVWDQFAPAGRARVRARVSREAGPDQPSRLPIEVALRDASFTYREFPYEMTGVSGEVLVDGPDVEVKRLASPGIHVSGAIRGIAGDPDVEIRIDATGLPLDDRLRRAIPASTKDLWDAFSPVGAVDVRWNVRKGRGRTPVHTAFARARGNTITYREVPLTVTDVEGEVEIMPEGVRLHHLTGKGWGGSSVEASGSVIGGRTTLHLDAVGLPLDATVREKLPKRVGDILKALHVTGTANFKTNLDLVKDGKTRVDLVVRLSKGAIDTEPRVDDLEGDVVLTGFFEKEPALMGFLNFSKAVIAGKRVTDVSSSFNMLGPRINFVNVKATAYGGIVSGRSFSINTDTGEYAGEFNVDRLDVREYSLDTRGFSEKTLGGKASLELKEFAGRRGDSSSITGTGKLTIRDGFLWDVPIFVSLFTLNPQDLFKAKSQFDSGVIDFEMKQRRFLIRGLVFSSESVSVLGKGAIDFDGNLDLILKTQTGFFGLDLPFIKIFTAIFDALKGAFHGVHVTGTFDKPETTQKLFPGSGEKE